LYLFRVIIGSLIVFILQVTMVPRMTVGGISPDLMVILLVILVKGKNAVFAVVVGFLLGFLQDLGNASYLGMNALAKSVVGYGIFQACGGLFPDNVIFRGLLILGASLVNDIIILTITTSVSLTDIFSWFFKFSVLSGISTAVIGVIVLEIINAATRRRTRTDGGF